MSHHKHLSKQWACQLTALPTRVLKDETVELTVTLSNGRGGILDEETLDDIIDSLTFVYDAEHPNVKIAIEEKQEKASTTSFIMPLIADGPCWIKVTVTCNKGQAAAAIALNQQGLAAALEEGWQDTFPDAGVSGTTTITVANRYGESRADVTLQRSSAFPTSDEGLWVAIRNRSAAIEFERYHKFVNDLFSGTVPDELPFNKQVGKFIKGIGDSSKLNIYGPYAYGVLKLATQAFLMLESGVVIDDYLYGQNGRKSLLSPDVLEKERIRLGKPIVSFAELQQRLSQYLVGPAENPVLPYLDRILVNLVSLEGKRDEVLPYFDGVLQHRLTSPSLIELIWSYWHEEGMLVQTMNTIALRFQNRRSSQHDPLGELELDPLRPLNNLIWGYIQDEHNRLTVPRRACEYQHHYGLCLVGKAVSGLIPADVRSKFIESFHNLLYRTAIFYREDSDTTVIADAFPLLNALKEVHLLLAEGAHNQFGDLPWTSRGEMLMMQWLLARPEMREFLRGRYMVPYQEPWMGAVDSMKKLQGWTDTTVTHFHELAVTGERILLSIRYGDWVDIENIEEQAKNWARYWKPEVQRYIHGYMTATGVDLMADVTDTRDAAVRFIQPSALLQRRLEVQAAQTAAQRNQSAPRLARPSSAGRGGFADLPMQTPSRLLRYKKDE